MNYDTRFDVAVSVQERSGSGNWIELYSYYGKSHPDWMQIRTTVEDGKITMWMRDNMRCQIQFDDPFIHAIYVAKYQRQAAPGVLPRAK